MSARYEIFLATNQQYYFRLKAPNGEIILQSEGYVTRAGAENGVASSRRHSPLDQHYVKRTSQNNQYYFVLRSANNQVIGVSETYTTTSARDNGISSVKAYGPASPLFHI